MSKLIIIGHKNPDTDSIVSAIVARDYFKIALGQDAIAYRAGELNNESKYVLNKYNVEAPELIGTIASDDRIVLVDHNEATQTFDGLDFSQVDYILDHHKLALSTEKPVFVRNEPIGSTSSLLAKMFFEKGVKISVQSAKLLISGILSDSLNLSSPTTTTADKELLVRLNETAKIDVDNFANEMFEAKSSLVGIATNDIVNLDYKIFEMGEYKVGIGTWETTNPISVNTKKEEIFDLLRKKKIAEQLDYLYFMIVDILKKKCHLYIISEVEQSLAENVFGGKVVDGEMELEGVMSRKKQIAPPLTKALTK